MILTLLKNNKLVLKKKNLRVVYNYILNNDFENVVIVIGYEKIKLNYFMYLFIRYESNGFEETYKLHRKIFKKENKRVNNFYNVIKKVKPPIST